jgi:hypothetical protein
MPDDPKNPDSLGDDRTFTGEQEAPAQQEQSLGDEGTHAGGMDSSISDLAIARKQWLQEAIKNPQEYSNRE